MLSFHVKFVLTDRWTMVKQYAPRSFDTGGIKRCLLKTLWEKEKMLLTSIFSFSHNVFLPIKDESNNMIHI